MSTQTSDWRTAPPSEKQLKYAKFLGITEAFKTAGDLSKAIDSAKKKTVNRVDRVKLDLKAPEQQEIHDATYDLTERLVAILLTVREVCEKVGIEEAPAIGMIFNQVCAQRRHETAPGLTQ